MILLGERPVRGQVLGTGERNAQKPLVALLDQRSEYCAIT